MSSRHANKRCLVYSDRCQQRSLHRYDQYTRQSACQDRPMFCYPEPSRGRNVVKQRRRTTHQRSSWAARPKTGKRLHFERKAVGVRGLSLSRQYGNRFAAFDEVRKDSARRVSGRLDHSHDRITAARSSKLHVGQGGRNDLSEQSLKVPTRSSSISGSLGAQRCA